MHTSLRCALFLLSSTTSCAMVLDFSDGNEPSDGGGNVGGAGTDGGGGIGPKLTGGGGEGAGSASDSWVASLSPATQGAAVEIQSLVVVGGTTWVSGYFTGSALLFHAADGSETELFTIPDANPEEQPVAQFATTFVLAIGDDGALERTEPLTQSILTESTEGGYAGARMALDEDGALYVVTTIQDGFAHFVDVETAGPGFNLLVAKLDTEGQPEWASRCSATSFSGNMVDAKSLSARHADLQVDAGTLFLGSTLQPDSTVTCEGVAISPEAGECTFEPLIGQGFQLMALDAESGACDASTHVVVEGGVEQTTAPVWLDALGLDAAGDLVVSGHAGQGPIVISPWTDNVAGDASVSFAGTLERADLGAQGSLRTFPSDFAPLVQSRQTFAGSVSGVPNDPMTSNDRANDVQLVRGNDVLLFGDPEELSKDEIVESLSVRGDAALITGRLSKGSDLAVDLCGEGCQGDLSSLATPCTAGALPNWDAFWLIVDTSTAAPLGAVGRAFGDCSDQSLVASALEEDTVTLVAEVQGSAVIDVLDGAPRSFAAGTGQAAVIVKMPRPTASAR